jgi:hypothetical protein
VCAQVDAAATVTSQKFIDVITTDANLRHDNTTIGKVSNLAFRNLVILVKLGLEISV